MFLVAQEILMDGEEDRDGSSSEGVGAATSVCLQ